MGALISVAITIMGFLSDQIKDLKTELKGDIAGLRTELKGDIAGLRTELKGDIAGLRTELKGEIKDGRSELRGLNSRVDFLYQRAVVEADRQAQLART